MDFLRHGEVQGGNYFRGITDDPLTETGWQQMRQQCGDQRWDVVISSPLRRCLDFASHLNQRQMPMEIDAAWAEIDFGNWEGLSAEQINQQCPDALAAFYADPAAYTPPNAESYTDFAMRAQSAWKKTVTAFGGQRVLVVTHAGVIRALFSQLLAIPPRQSLQIDVPHACLTRFSCFQDVASSFVQLNFHRPC